MKNIIFILIIIVLALSLYISFTHNKYNTNNDTQTIVDTVFVNSEARIDTVWFTKTKLDTIFIETILQGDTIIVAHTDTIYVQESDIIASIDTAFVSDDKMVKSDLSIKYSYNNQSFYIKNTLSHTYMPPNTPIESRFPLGGIIYVSGNKNSIGLGFGLSYRLLDNVDILCGYDTLDRITIGFGVSLP